MKAVKTMLTERQKELIRETYIPIARREYSTGEIFYANLFALDPTLRPLFRNDMREMRLKFVQMMGTVVSALELGSDITPIVQKLGQRHSGYGVEPGHYRLVKMAFLETLAQVLGEKFTPEVQDAWDALFNAITEIAAS